MSDPKAIVDEFCTLCTSVRMHYDLYRTLFEEDPRNLDLYTSIAPLCFGDLSRILIEYLLLAKSRTPQKPGTNSISRLIIFWKRFRGPKRSAENFGRSTSA
jgi:hypothetical protein